MEICKTCLFMSVVLILMKTLFCEENLSNTQQNLICKLQFIIGLHSKEKLVWFSFFDIWTKSENRILTLKLLKILFWHSLWVGKFYFDIQNSILTFALSSKILFWHSKSYFDIRYESEKSYFDVLNPILSFAMSRKILCWHSNFYSGIRTESEKPILTFKILLLWVGKSYFDIQSPILTFSYLRFSDSVLHTQTHRFPGCIFGKAC